MTILVLACGPLSGLTGSGATVTPQGGVAPSDGSGPTATADKGGPATPPPDQTGVPPEAGTPAPIPETQSTIPPTAAVGAEYHQVLQGDIGTGGEQDTYTFTAAPGQEFFFGVIEFAPDLPQVDWRVSGPDGSQVFATCLGCGNPGVYTLAQAGDYTVVVGEADTSEVGAYQVVVASVRVHYFPITLDTTIVEGDPGPGAGNIETPGARDMFTFEAQPGQEVYFGVVEFVGIPQAQIVLLDPNALEVFWSCLGCGNPGAYRLETGGTYTLVIGGDIDLLTGTYQVVVVNVRTDRFEITPGSPISDGVPGPGAGNIETPGGRDVYTFTASPGETLHFEVPAQDNIPLMNWRLTDESGAEVFNTCLGCTVPGDYTLERGGTYTLTIGGETAIETGTYQLDIRRP